MGATPDVFTLSWTAIIMISFCGAEHSLPEPTDISFEWIDPFVLQLNWSWTEPKDLQNCEVEYNLQGLDGEIQKIQRVKGETPKPTSIIYLTKYIATKEIHIHVEDKNCSDWTTSKTVRKILEVPNHTELVKDFMCFVKSGNLTGTCIWTPVDPSLNLRVSYRKKGKLEEDIKPPTTCQVFKYTETQKACRMSFDPDNPDNIWVLVETDSQRHTFEPRLVVPLPNVTLRRQGDHLNVTWQPPKDLIHCLWDFNIWYEACNKIKPTVKEKGNFLIPYNRCCNYTLHYNISTKHCLDISSNTSGILTYVTDESCFSVATLLTIVIPIVVFIFILLCCYCFRRYKDIICPIVPVPLDLFKGLVAGSRDARIPVVPLYTPMESIEPCKIMLIPENKVCQQSE